MKPSGALFALPDGEPVVFAGPPEALRARLPLCNDTDTRLSLRGALVEVAGLPAAQVSLVAVLVPGARTVAGAVLRLDPATPPGSYLGEVTLAGHRRPAQVVVLARASLAVVPGRVLVTEVATTITVVVRNDGNQALELAELVRADVGDPPDESTVTGRLSGPATIEPGRTAVLALTVGLPAGLDPTRRHLARLPLGPAEIEVVVPPRTPATVTPKAVIPKAVTPPVATRAPRRPRKSPSRSTRRTT